MYKIIIFGCGSGAQKVINALKEEVNVIAFADNDLKKQNTIYSGVKVINPINIKDYVYDFIVIGSQYNIAIKKQLLKLGIKEKKIFDFYNYICTINFIKENIEYFGKYALELDYETIITGISYANNGFDVKTCKSKTFRFSFASQDIYYDYNIIKYVLNNYKDKIQNIKYALIGLSYYSFQYDMSLSSMKNRVLLYYQAINLKHNLKDVSILKLDEQPNKKLVEKLFKTDGYKNIIIQWDKKGDIVNISDKDEAGKLQAELDCNKNYPETVKENISLMKEYLDMLEKNHIKPIIIVFPASKYYTKYFSKRIEDEFQSIISDLIKKYKFQYIDYFRSEQFEDVDFVDVSHLSSIGATKFTEILNNQIEW